MRSAGQSGRVARWRTAGPASYRGSRPAFLLARVCGEASVLRVQTCSVHLSSRRLKYVPGRERERVARELKPIYTAVDAAAAQAELESFDETW
jgi:mutator family transposase